jgi:hypothetical protein
MAIDAAFVGDALKMKLSERLAAGYGAGTL